MHLSNNLQNTWSLNAEGFREHFTPKKLQVTSQMQIPRIPTALFTSQLFMIHKFTEKEMHWVRGKSPQKCTYNLCGLIKMTILKTDFQWMQQQKWKSYEAFARITSSSSGVFVKRKLSSDGSIYFQHGVFCVWYQHKWMELSHKYYHTLAQKY